MKKLMTLCIVGIFILSALSLGSFAAMTADKSELSFGGKSQSASNPQADKESYKDQYADPLAVTLTNSDSANDVTGLSWEATYPIADITAEKLDIDVTFSDANNEIAASGTTTATIKVRVPENLDAVDSDYRESSFEVAKLKFKGTQSGSEVTTSEISVKVQRENQLEIDKVEICVNGNERCVSLDDGDDLNNLRPLDELDMNIVVGNRYSDSSREDLDMESVELFWELDEDEWSEDDSESMGDISADSDSEESFSFEVDEDADNGKAQLKIWVFGEDENLALHGHMIEIDLEVDKKNDDIDIRRTSVSPSLLSCDNRKTSVTVGFTNLGSSDQDEVAVEVTNDVLGITKRKGIFSLDEGDSRTETFSITVPEDAEAGVYDLMIRSYFDTSSLSDEDKVQITVPECEEPDEDVDSTDSSDDTTVVTVTPVTPKPVARPVTSTPDTTDSDFRESPFYTALLVLGVLVLVVLLVVVVVKFLAPRDE